MTNRRTPHASPDVAKARTLTSLKVISLPWFFTVRAPHGRLTAKLVCTFCVPGGGKTDDGRGGLVTTAFPRKRSQTKGHLDVDAMVKASLGTLLGGRLKDSITDITRI